MRLTPRALTRSWLVLATAVVAALPVAAPALAAQPTAPKPLPHAVGGYVPGAVVTSAKTRLGNASALEVLPESVDLRSYAPSPGDQGQIGSCVAWSIAYSIMGYYANRTGAVGAPYAPLFLYMRNVAANGAPKAGLYPDSVLANAQTAGVDTQAHYWQGTTNWQAPPSQDEIDNARNYRLSGWNRLFVGTDQGTAAQTLIKQTLASGSPVALGIPVFQDFMYLRSHSLYNTLSGSSLGGHMIAAYGYDAQGVYIRNSWGTGWGNGGDAKLSWAFITKVATGAYAVNGIATPSTPIPTAPTVAALSIGKAVAGTAVTIAGAGLSTATEVRFGTEPATFTRQTANGLTKLVAVAPAHPAGVVDVTVTNPAGTSAAGAASRFTYVPPAPVVTSLTPSSGPTYKSTPVVIKGTDFAGATRVTLGGSTVWFTRVSPTELRLTLPARSAGELGLQITAPGGVSTVGAAATFTYVAPPAPVITSITPDNGRTNARTEVVVNGLNFTDSTRLTLGGASVPYTRISATQVKATLPAHAAGTFDLLLTTRGGITAAGPDTRFTYRLPPVPVISTLSVTKAITRTWTPVTITGSGLTGATRVTVGGTAMSFTRVSDTEIRLTVPPRTTAGEAPIVVTAPGGTSTPAAFSFVPATATMRTASWFVTGPGRPVAYQR